MNYDLYAEYPCETQDDIRRIVGNIKGAHAELEDIYIKIVLLTPSVVEKVKEYAKSGHFKYGGGYKTLVYSERGPNPYSEKLIRPVLKDFEKLKLYPPKVDLGNLPHFSFFLQIHFTLATPCHIGGSELFYIHECSQLKDLAFKVPMLPPSSWKGHFRYAATRLIQEGEKEAVVERLFGAGAEEAMEKEEALGQGRLRFYPTFFDTIGLDLINPHSRRTKAGTVPILEEIATPGAKGVLSLLYIPVDLLGGLDLDKAKKQVKEDLFFTYAILKDVLHTYGFSAKNARGFGLAQYKYSKILNGGKEAPGGFLEMAGVPVYKEAEKPESGKDNTFSYLNQLKRIVDKIANKLS